VDTGLYNGDVLLLVVPRFLWEHRPCLYAALAEGLERPSTDELGCSGISMSVPRIMHCVPGINYFLIFL